MSIDNRVEPSIMSVNLSELPSGTVILAYTKHSQYRLVIGRKIGDGGSAIVETTITGGSKFPTPKRIIYNGAGTDDGLVPGMLCIGDRMYGTWSTKVKKFYHGEELEPEPQRYEFLSSPVRHIELQPANSNVTPLRRIKKVR